MEVIDIRSAHPRHARAIPHVQVETWRSAYRGIVADDYLDALSEKDRVGRWLQILGNPEQVTYVAEVKRHGVVGFLNGGPEREGREVCQGEIYALYVLPAWHRRGIGSGLVAAFVQWLTDSGFTSMVVWVLEENPCRRFYERSGGKLAGKKHIRVGQQTLGQVLYAWDDLSPGPAS